MLIRIRTRILALICVLALLFFAGLFLQWDYEKERTRSLLAARRLENGLLLERVMKLTSRPLSTYTYDYTYWDEMYRFVDAPTEEWAEANLASTLETFGAQVIWVYDENLRLIYSADNLSDSSDVALPLSGSELQVLVHDRWFSHFYARSGDRVLEIHGAPIQHGDDVERKGKPHGFMFVSRTLDEDYSAGIALLTGGSVRVLNETYAKSSFNENDFSIVNQMTLHAWDGRPIAVLSCESIYGSALASRKELQHVLLGNILFILSVVLVISTVLLRYVSNPLRRISASLSAQNPTLIEGVQRCGTEFADVAALMIDFFRQKNALQAEIEQRTQSESALRASEQRFRELADLLPVAIFEADNSGRLTFISTHAYSMLGTDADHIPKDMNLLDAVAPEDRLLARAEMLKILDNRAEPGGTEFKGIRNDGSEFHMLVDAVPIIIDGQVTGLRGFAMDITSRKDAESIVRQNSELMQALMETIPIPICCLDTHGRVQHVWNPAAEQLLGWTKSETLGKPLPCIPEERQEKFQAAMSLVAHGKPVTGVESIVQDRNGSPIHALLYCVPFSEPGGKVIGSMAAMVDLSESKRAEQALRESEERFRNLSDTAPVLIWMAGVDRHCYYFNKTWLRFTGRSLQQEYGKGWMSGVHPEDLPQCLETYRGAFNARRPFSIEFRLKAADGSFRWMLDRGTPRFTSDGGFAGYIGTCTDISERRSAEEALRESEERFKAIFDNARDAVFIRDRNLVYTHANPGSERFLDYPPSRVIGKRNKDLYSEEIAEPINATDFRVLQGETTEEEHAMLVNGVMTTFHLIKVPMRDRAGRIVGICGIARDITDRKRAEESLRQHEHYLRTIFESLGIGMMIVDAATHKILDVNQTVARMAGRKREDMLGSVCHRFVCTADKGRCPVSDLCQTVDNSERVLLRADEIPLPILKTVVPVTLSGRACLLETMVDISERKEAEQEVADSNRRFELVVASSGQVVYEYNVRTGLIHWSGGLQEVLGSSVSKTIGTIAEWSERIHPADRDEAIRLLEIAEQHGTSYDVKYRYRHEGGHYIWMHDRGFFVTNPAGDVVSMLGMMNDVTESLLAKEALRHSEERYRVLVDASDDFIYSYDLQGRFTSANKALCSVLNKSPDKIIGRTHAELGFPPESVRDWDALHARVKATSEMVRATTSTYMGELGLRWYDVVLNPIRDENGVVTGIAGISRDITDLRTAEDAAREKNQAYRFIGEYLQDVVWRLDRNLRFTYVSPSIQRLIGYTPSEMCTKTLSDVLTTESYERAIRRIAEVFDTDSESIRELPLMEFEHIRKDGSRVWAEVTSVAVCGASSEVTGMIGITRDITERKRTEQKLRQSAESAEAIIEAVPMPMIVMNPATGRVIFTNEPLRRVLGADRDWTGGKTGLGHFDSDEQRAAMLDALRQEGCIHGIEINLSTAGGEQIGLIGSARLFTLDGEDAIVAMAVPPRIREGIPGISERQTNDPRTISHYLESLYHEIKDSLDRARQHTKVDDSHHIPDF